MGSALQFAAQVKPDQRKAAITESGSRFPADFMKMRVSLINS
ncbi:hypothetical protein [Komagataeibacter melaceti]|nr:hypothetical protein [Komagataeibacter melaceti]